VRRGWSGGGVIEVHMQWVLTSGIGHCWLGGYMLLSYFGCQSGGVGWVSDLRSGWYPKLSHSGE
jgi:hypothetical protein